MATMKATVTKPAVRPGVKPTKPAGASQIAGRPTSTGGAALPNNVAPNMNKPMSPRPGAPPGDQVSELMRDPSFQAHIGQMTPPGTNVSLPPGPSMGIAPQPAVLPVGGGGPLGPGATLPRGNPGIPSAPMGRWRGPNKIPSGGGVTGQPVVDQMTPETPPGDEMQGLTGGPLMAPPGGMDARMALRNALRGSGRGSLFGPNFQQ